MKQGINVIPISLAVIIGILLQILFVTLDGKETPGTTAVEFAKAYFKLDKSMTEYLCCAMTSDEDDDLVAQYIDKAKNKANSRGFGINYMKSTIYHIKTYTVYKDTSNAVVRISAKKIKSINPFYTCVAKIFHICQTSEINETINVICEGEKWKVCGKVFSLSKEC